MLVEDYKTCTQANVCMNMFTDMHSQIHEHALFPSLYLFSIYSCLLCPIFSHSSAQMPSTGLIKAAPSCCHRNGLARPLASPSAGCPNHTRHRKEHGCGSGLLFNHARAERMMSPNVNSQYSQLIAN